MGATARLIFLLQDLRILLPHEAHKIHHTNGTNPCLIAGWWNCLLNPIVARDDHYDVVPRARLDQPIYDIPQVEQERIERLERWYGKGAVEREK